MRISVSCAQRDADLVGVLARILRDLGHEVWSGDLRTDAGVRQMHECDVVILALSRAYFEAYVWRAERRRATDVGKPTLLVSLLRHIGVGESTLEVDRAQLSAALAAIPVAPERSAEQPREVRADQPAVIDAPMPGWFGRGAASRTEHFWDGTTWDGRRWEVPRSIFVSYSRADEEMIGHLVDDLELARLTVWRDTALGGGVDWWREILAQIRGAALFVHALSDGARASEPCRLERGYADALGVPMLPVQVGTITSLRTWEVSEHQIIDYRGREPEQRIRVVAGAMARLGDRRPPPSPLPVEPATPYGYLREIRRRLELSELDRRQQHEILLDVRERLHDELDASARADLLQMLRDLAARRDAVRIVMNDVAAVLAQFGAGPDGALTEGQSWTAERGPYAF